MIIPELLDAAGLPRYGRKSCLIADAVNGKQPIVVIDVNLFAVCQQIIIAGDGFDRLAAGDLPFPVEIAAAAQCAVVNSICLNIIAVVVAEKRCAVTADEAFDLAVPAEQIPRIIGVIAVSTGFGEQSVAVGIIADCADKKEKPP